MLRVLDLPVSTLKIYTPSGLPAMLISVAGSVAFVFSSSCPEVLYTQIEATDPVPKPVISTFTIPVVGFGPMLIPSVSIGDAPGFAGEAFAGCTCGVAWASRLTLLPPLSYSKTTVWACIGQTQSTNAVSHTGRRQARF